MAGIVIAALSPHPPLIVPAVGRGEEEKVTATVRAMAEMARCVVAAKPDVMVLISPHAQLYRDAVVALATATVVGSLAEFGAPDERYEFGTDEALVDLIVAEAATVGVRVLKVDRTTRRQYEVSAGLDHGMMVPLHYLRAAGLTTPLVPMGMAICPPDQLYRFGQALALAAVRSGKRVALIASGDLSHHLTADAPAGYDPRGVEFDRELMQALGDGDVVRIVTLDRGLIDAAGECGYRPVVEMLGALDGHRVAVDILSYEGPFGVGYGVAVLTPGPADPGRLYGERIAQARQTAVASRRATESAPVRLARESLEAFVERGEVVATPADLPAEFRERQAGVFVSIKKDGELRGCIGTIEPVRAAIAQEIIYNAISAGTADPRFDPVEPAELNELVYSVDVLASPEPISGLTELDPQQYGVIVSKGGRSGLLLPRLEGITTAQEQYRIACQKAGLKPDAPGIKLERFVVVRHT